MAKAPKGQKGTHKGRIKHVKVPRGKIVGKHAKSKPPSVPKTELKPPQTDVTEQDFQLMMTARASTATGDAPTPEGEPWDDGTFWDDGFGWGE